MERDGTTGEGETQVLRVEPVTEGLDILEPTGTNFDEGTFSAHKQEKSLV